MLAGGIGASMVYALALVAGPARWPGYSSTDQTISELFAVGAPSRPRVVALLAVHGVLALLFGIGVVSVAEHDRALRAAGALLLGIGVVDQLGPFFPMHRREVIAAGGATATDTMHIVLTSIISVLTVMAMGFTAAASGPPFRVYSVASIVVVTGFGAAASRQARALARGRPTPWQGVTERIDVGAYLLWMAALAIVLLRGSSRSAALSSQARPAMW